VEYIVLLQQKRNQG